jgi:hypothetical protein
LLIKVLFDKRDVQAVVVTGFFAVLGIELGALHFLGKH